MVSSTYGYQGIFLSVLYLVKIASFSQQSTTAILSVSVSLYQSCNVISHFSPGHKKYISHMLRYPFDQHISDMEVKKLIEHFPSPCLDALSKFRNISYSATLPNGTVMTINSFDYVDANICSFSRSLTVEINNPISNLSYEESTEVYEVLSSIFKQSGDVSKFSHASVYSSGVAVEFFQSLQTRIEKFCIDVLNDIDILLCAQFKQRVFTNVLKQIKAHLLSLPSVQWQPSPQDAFVYLHIEKTGGTTLRELIVQAAKKLGRNVFIPCYHGLSCLTFTHPVLDTPSTIGSKLISHIVAKHFAVENLSVLAGHFLWDVWHALPYYAQHSFEMSTSSPTLPHILVINRHPIERVISYYYQRCYDLPHCNPAGKLLRDWTEMELESLMLSYRAWYVDEDLQRLTYSLQRKYETCLNMSVCQEYDAVEHEIVRMHGGRREAEIVVIDDGMADAACRAILSKKATTNIRFMAKYGSFVLPFPEPLAETDVQKALERADHVVVGLQEYWEDSIRVINFFFPWIDFMHKFDYVKMPSSYRSLDTRATLPSQLLAVIEKYNACDLALYAKMKSVFAKQKKLVLDV